MTLPGWGQKVLLPAIIPVPHMIGKKITGSGYADILIEINLATSGCFRSVLNGKHYAKALFCLYCVSEALERFLFE